MAGAKCSSFQLIDEGGNLDVGGLDEFVNNAGLLQSGNSYRITSIIGPQNGGKSTLLNDLFQTNFTTLGPELDLGKTTNGIWMDKCKNVSPFTIVMDVEGTDGKEREGNKTFENQSALLAFAVSDIIMINMHWKDIGRDTAGCKPLLRIVFNHIARHFGPRRAILLFVLRDKSTLGSKLEGTVVDDVRKIWKEETVGKPSENLFNDYFSVAVTALPYYKENEYKSEIRQEN